MSAHPVRAATLSCRVRCADAVAKGDATVEVPCNLAGDPTTVELVDLGIIGDDFEAWEASTITMNGCASIPSSRTTFYPAIADAGTNRSVLSTRVCGKCEDAVKARCNVETSSTDGSVTVSVDAS